MKIFIAVNILRRWHCFAMTAVKIPPRVPDRFRFQLRVVALRLNKFSLTSNQKTSFCFENKFWRKVFDFNFFSLIRAPI